MDLGSSLRNVSGSTAEPRREASTQKTADERPAEFKEVVEAEGDKIAAEERDPSDESAEETTPHEGVAVRARAMAPVDLAMPASWSRLTSAEPIASVHQPEGGELDGATEEGKLVAALSAEMSNARAAKSKLGGPSAAAIESSVPEGEAPELALSKEPAAATTTSDATKALEGQGSAPVQTATPAPSPTPVELDAEAIGATIQRLLEAEAPAESSDASVSAEGEPTTSPVLEGKAALPTTPTTTTTRAAPTNPASALIPQGMDDLPEIGPSLARLRGKSMDMRLALDGEQVLLRVRGNGSEVHISATTSTSVREALESGIDRIRAALEEHGLSLGSLDVATDEREAEQQRERDEAETAEPEVRSPARSISATHALRRVRALA